MRRTNIFQRGATLIELIAFLVIIGITLAATVNVFTQSLVTNTDPLIRVRALELAQAQLDDILARKFDENTPTGGVPACDSITGTACDGITADTDFDDVGDYQGFVDSSSYAGYEITVSVTEAGSDLGLTDLLGNPDDTQARLISVTVSTPALGTASAGIDVTLAVYKVNF